MTEPDVQAIVKGLTKAQREVMLGASPRGGTKRSLVDVGLMSLEPRPRTRGYQRYEYHFTPLGLAVRAALATNATGEEA